MLHKCAVHTTSSQYDFNNLKIKYIKYILVDMINRNNCLTSLAIFLINMACCLCYVNYEMFKGFDLYDYNQGPDSGIVSSVNQTSNVTTVKGMDVLINNQTSTTNNTVKKSAKQKAVKLKCPENEHPVSLGTYEIPTQQDLMLFTKRTLLKMFKSYHKKTLFLLKDIKEATRATEVFVKKCPVPNKEHYKNCVKLISKKCIAITKNLVAIMEGRKQSVAVLLEGRICNMTDMKTDPIQLVISIAMDAASLEFALPAFLRLIGGCSAHCSRHFGTGRQEAIHRPSRHMTDQDLVIKHFLTSKNYIQLIKDSDTHV